MANYARFVKGEDFDLAIDYTPGGAVSAGNVVVLGDLVGVARLDIAAGARGQLHIGGVYDFPKSTAGGSGQVAGTTMYWDSGNNIATPTAGGNKMLGKMEVASADADTTARIILCPWSLVTFNPVTAGIADPGNAGAIPVTNAGHVDIVTAGAETRTLAAPTAAGIQLVISLKTKVGNAVLTVADPHIDGTNNTVTFDTQGDVIGLVSYAVGAAFGWALVFNVGAALSHV